MSCYSARVMPWHDMAVSRRIGRLRGLAHGLLSAFIAGFLSLTVTACMIDTRMQSMGEITLVRGNVFLARAEMLRPEAVVQAHPVFAYDVLETQAQSGAHILLEHARLMLGPNSRLTLHAPDGDHRTSIILDRGTLRMNVAADPENLWTMEVIAAGSRTFTTHGQITVWVQEEVDAPQAGEPGTPAIRSVGVINHGTEGETTFEAMGRSVIVRRGYFSAMAPDHFPIQAVTIDVANPFVTDVVQTTNLDLHSSAQTTTAPTATTATNPSSPTRPAVPRVTETVAQRACKKQKETVQRIKPSADSGKSRLTHCL
jgi:hypothetical protein